VAETKLGRYQKRFEKLKSEANEHEPLLETLRDYFWPRNGRFLGEKKSDSGNKHTRVINNAAIMARRTLMSGMQSGVTNESRPWFMMQTADLDMMEHPAVAQWLETVQKLMYQILARSNLYNTFFQIYGNLGVYGTASADVLYDYEDVVRGYPAAVGSYYLAANERDVVDTRYRRINMTVETVVKKFGYKNCSKAVQRLWDNSNYDEEVKVIHVIEPRHDRDPDKPDSKNMAFASCYFEEGCDTDGMFLRESGYDEFPGVAPRWEVNDGRVYGDSPAMDALGDNKQLQIQERRKGQGIDKGLSPPMVGTGQLQAGTRTNLLPGKTTWMSSAGAGSPLIPAYQIDPTFVRFLSEDSKEVVQRINDAFYVDLFMMLSQSDRREITAREIEERHEEKLLMLGPVLNRLRDELYDPVIRRVFNIALREEALPPPPPELDGMELNVQYISILHQAQQAVGLVGIDRLTGYVGNLAAVNPDILDKVDFDEAVEEYHRMTGAPKAILRAPEKVEAMRQQRAQQEQQMQQAAMAQQAAEGAKTLSEARTEDPSALRTLLDTMGGGGA